MFVKWWGIILKHIESTSRSFHRSILPGMMCWHLCGLWVCGTDVSPDSRVKLIFYTIILSISLHVRSIRVNLLFVIKKAPIVQFIVSIVQLSNFRCRSLISPIGIYTRNIKSSASLNEVKEKKRALAISTTSSTKMNRTKVAVQSTSTSHVSISSHRISSYLMFICIDISFS